MDEIIDNIIFELKQNSKKRKIEMQTLMIEMQTYKNRQKKVTENEIE